jgi:hypothetical protein
VRQCCDPALKARIIQTATDSTTNSFRWATMSKTSPFSIATIITWLAVVAWLIWLAANHFLTGLYYQLDSERSSPDGRMTIYSFQSLQDGLGHAPYGHTLALSRHGRIREPDEGYVFFAGYCVSPVQYEWKTDNRVFVRCQRGRDTKIRTLATMMYGIQIEFSDR